MSDLWKCPTCGEKYRSDVLTCRNCGTPSMIKHGGLTGVRRPLRRTKSESEIPAVPEIPEPAAVPPPAPLPAPAPPPPAPPPPEDAPVEVRFPVILKGLRYSLPVVTGEVWTSGWAVAVAEGLYLISEEDGLDPKKVGAKVTPAEGHLARHSVFFSKDTIFQIARDEKLVGEYLQARGGRIQLRLSPEGWEELDVIRQALGISG